ncbi:MAG: hydroxymethylglutaryl-CoA lyase [Bacteroidetes bacterium]|nr:hydroxymethylglutaryl-CoA lyase [Bacteroidota bacterium]
MNTNRQNIKIIETPRDGMQGLDTFIPTHKKIEYINILLQCGFDTVEVGSFVSPKAIPQMADTAEVLKKLDYSKTNSNIAVLAANLKGGELAAQFEEVDLIFYPYSSSPTFLKKNLNTTIKEAERTVEGLQNLCIKKDKKLVAFISLAFGDPYGDPWSIDLINKKVEKLLSLGITRIPLADTIGDVHPEVIDKVCGAVIPNFPEVEFGLHAHAYPGKGKSKIAAAWKHGVRHFDTVIGGIGGCPMTDKELVGNLSLESLMTWCETEGVETGLDLNRLREAQFYPLIK